MTYGYDEFGNVAWKEYITADNQTDHPGQLYTYDSVGQLTSLTWGELNSAHDGLVPDTPYGTQNWSPDPLGNLGAANDANQVTASGYAYDRAGNMTSGPLSGIATYSPSLSVGGQGHYVYDAWNRLVEVDAVDGGTTTQLTYYAYDGLGRRVLEYSPSYFGGEMLWDTYAGQQMVQQRDVTYWAPSNSAVVNQYVYSLRGDIPILRDGDVGPDGPEVAEDRIYYLTDANNNVTAVVGDVEGAGGPQWQVFNRYDYDPYGHITITEGGTANCPLCNNNILFAGREMDWATGLYYNRARWYDPATGVFLTPDPAAADVNLYRYCGNNPISRTDPTGLDTTYNVLPFTETYSFWYQDPLYCPDGTWSSITVPAGATFQTDGWAWWNWNNCNNPNPPPGFAGAALGWWPRSDNGSSVPSRPVSNKPGFWEGLIPVWGSYWSARDDFDHGRWVWGSINGAMAVTDVIIIGAVAKAGGKVILKVGGKILWRETAEVGSKEAAQGGFLWWGKKAAGRTLTAAERLQLEYERGLLKKALKEGVYEEGSAAWTAARDRLVEIKGLLGG